MPNSLRRARSVIAIAVVVSFQTCALAQAVGETKQACDLIELNKQRVARSFDAFIPLDDPYSAIPRVTCLDKILNTKFNLLALFSFNISALIDGLIQRVLNNACASVTSSWGSFLNRVRTDYEIETTFSGWGGGEPWRPPGGSPGCASTQIVPTDPKWPNLNNLRFNLPPGTTGGKEFEYGGKGTVRISVLGAINMETPPGTTIELAISPCGGGFDVPDSCKSFMAVSGSLRIGEGTACEITAGRYYVSVRHRNESGQVTCTNKYNLGYCTHYVSINASDTQSCQNTQSVGAFTSANQSLQFSIPRGTTAALRLPSVPVDDTILLSSLKTANMQAGITGEVVISSCPGTTNVAPECRRFGTLSDNEFSLGAVGGSFPMRGACTLLPDRPYFVSVRHVNVAQEPSCVGPSCEQGLKTSSKSACAPSGVQVQSFNDAGNVLRLVGGNEAIFSVALPKLPVGQGGGQFTFIPTPSIPVPANGTVDVSISKCNGKIDDISFGDAGKGNYCNYRRSGAQDINQIRWLESPSQSIRSAADANAMGYCWAADGGQYYVNLRYRFTQCAPKSPDGRCGFVAQYN